MKSSNLYSKLGLRTQWTLLILLMLAASLWAGYWVSSRVEREALNEVRHYVETLARALDVRVQRLSFDSGAAESGLVAYQTELRSGGVRQIKLFDPNGRLIAQTPLAPAPAGDGIGLYETMDLTIPVLSDGKLLGYMGLKFSFANFQGLFNRMLWSKTLLSILIFALGWVVAWPLAGLMTRSFRGLADASRKVSQGDLEVELPPPSDRDSAALTSAFERMIATLARQREMELKMASAEREAAIGRMASGIAHDLRNPLNYVKLSVQEARARLNSTPDSEEKTRLLVDGVCLELERMEEIISDLLDFGRPVSPSLDLENPLSALRDSVEDVRRRHADGEAPIEVATESFPETVSVDARLLRRALANLLENALEASPAGTPVRAGCSLSGDRRKAEIWVEDSGPGIPPDQTEKIFTPYFTTKASGVGLGLALSSKWVQEMGGEMRAGNRPQGGARFEIVFPLEDKGDA